MEFIRFPSLINSHFHDARNENFILPHCILNLCRGNQRCGYSLTVVVEPLHQSFFMQSCNRSGKYDLRDRDLEVCFIEKAPEENKECFL